MAVCRHMSEFGRFQEGGKLVSGGLVGWLFFKPVYRRILGYCFTLLALCDVAQAFDSQFQVFIKYVVSQYRHEVFHCFKLLLEMFLFCCGPGDCLGCHLKGPPHACDWH